VAAPTDWELAVNDVEGAKLAPASEPASVERPPSFAGRAQLVQRLSTLPYEQQVQLLAVPPNYLAMASPSAGAERTPLPMKGGVGRQVQKAEGGAPDKVKLKLAGKTINVRLPAGAKKTASLSIDQEVGGVKLSSANVKFDDQWEIKSGSVKGEAGVTIADIDCRAKFNLRIGKKGRIAGNTQNGTISAGPMSGKVKLKVSKDGLGGTATVTVNSNIPISVGPGELLIGAGSSATATLSKGTMSKLNVTKLTGSFHDSIGELVGISGKASYSKSSFSASGKATLARTLETKLGIFSASLDQGATKGTIALDKKGVKKLSADFQFGVEHPTFGRFATGNLKGVYAKNGDKISGEGTVTTNKDIEVGKKETAYLIMARAGSKIGARVDEKGKAAVIFSVESEFGAANKWIAKGAAKNVAYDGESLAGDFDLRINPNFQFTVGPLTTQVRSNGKMGISYVKNKLSANGGDLHVGFKWNGKDFGLKWPSWSLEFGKLGPLPTIDLPEFDFSGILAWLKGLLPGLNLDWLWSLWERISLKLPSFSGVGFPNFLNFFRGLRLPFPDPFPLLGLPEFNWDLVIGNLWDQFLAFLGTFRFNVSLPDLQLFFEGLSIPGFNFDFFGKLFGGGSGLSLKTDGDLEIRGRGAEIPAIVGTNLSAMLLKDGTELAALESPSASYDGKTLAALVKLRFPQGVGPTFGEYAVKLEETSVNLLLEAGQPMQITLASLAVSLRQGKKKVATGTIGNVPITGDGIDLSNASIGVQLQKTLPVGKPGSDFSFSLLKGSALGLGLRDGKVGTISGKKVALDVKKGGKRFCKGEFTSFAYDVDDGVKYAKGSVDLKQKIKVIDGLDIKKGKVTATVEDNALTRVEVAGLDVSFVRTIKGKRLNLKGNIKKGVVDLKSGILEHLDAELKLQSKLSVGSDTAKIWLNKGSLRLLIQKNDFKGLFFKKLDLGAKAGKVQLSGTADGALEDDGASLKADVSLTKKVSFGTKDKGISIAKGGKASVNIEKGTFKSFGLDTEIAFTAGPMAATGKVKGTYDGTNVNGTVAVRLDEDISIGSGDFVGTLKEDSEIGATITNNEVTGVVVPKAAFELKVKGQLFKATITKGKWGASGFSFNLAAAVSSEAVGTEIQLGNLKLSLTGGSVNVDVKNSELKEVELADLGAEVTYPLEDGKPLKLGLGFNGGKWNASGVTGSATVSLLSPITFGSPELQFSLLSGSSTIEVASNQLTKLSIANLQGTCSRNGALLATLVVTAGEYDFVNQQVTAADILFFMAPNESFEVLDGVHLSGVNGAFTLNQGVIDMSAGANIKADFGDNRVLTGGVTAHWKRSLDGKDSFDGTTGTIAGVLLNEPNGRYLGGDLTVTVENGTPLFSGEIDFALNKDMGGKVTLETKREGNTLDPVVKKGSVSFAKDLMGPTDLIDVPIGDLDEGLAKGGGHSAAELKFGGGLKLKTDPLTAMASIGVKEWHPLKGGAPALDEAGVGLDWGFNLGAELMGQLDLRVTFAAVLNVKVGLKGGIGAWLNVDFNPVLKLKQVGDDYEFELDFGLTISPKAEAILSILIGMGIDIKVASLDIEFPSIDFGFPLGELFNVEIGSGAQSDHKEAAKDLPAVSPDTVPAVSAHGSKPATKGVEGHKAVESLEAKSANKGGSSSGLAKLLAQVELIEKAAAGLQALGMLIGKIMRGISAFVMGGPVGFAIWALWQLIDGGVGDIVVAIATLQVALPAINDLLGDFLKTEPDMAWLADALTLLDTEADDNARKKVNAEEHKRADLPTQANLVKAMYAGFTGDEDEGCILIVFRDSSNLESLLIAIDGDPKAGVDNALGELQGSEDDELRQLLRSRGLAHLIDIADDVYARECVADGTYRDMSTAQRARLVAMMESGDCGDADERAINKVLAFSMANGDIGGVLTGAFGSVESGMNDLEGSLDGAENKAFWRIMGDWSKKRLLGPHQRWKAQFDTLPDKYKAGAREVIDNSEKLIQARATWNDALRVLANKSPFKRPMTGPCASDSWAALEAGSPIVASLNAEQREKLGKAIHGTGLRSIKRDIALAVLEGGSVSANDKIKQWLKDEEEAKKAREKQKKDKETQAKKK